MLFGTEVASFVIISIHREICNSTLHSDIMKKICNSKLHSDICRVSRGCSRSKVAGVTCFYSGHLLKELKEKQSKSH